MDLFDSGESTSWLLYRLAFMYVESGAYIYIHHLCRIGGGDPNEHHLRSLSASNFASEFVNNPNHHHNINLQLAGRHYITIRSIRLVFYTTTAVILPSVIHKCLH